MVKQSGLRARDVDRNTTVTALDNAYAEGQLNYEEHRARAERARAAVGLGELDVLVADLQIRTAMPARAIPPVGRAAGPGLLRWAVAVAGLLVLGAVVWFVVRDSSTDDESAAVAATPTTATVAPDDVTPIVAPRVDFTTAAGFTEFVDLYRARFGDTIADGLSIQFDGGYASFSRAEEIDRERDYTFRGGFDPGDLAAREPNTQVIDISKVNPEGYESLLRQAVEQVGLRDGAVTHASLRSGRDGPEILVYVANVVRESDYVKATFDGQIIPRP